MTTNAVIIRTLSAGVLDFSPIINVAVGAFCMLTPENNNVFIKKISLFVSSSQANNFIFKFFNVRFRIVNRDLSDNINIAGNIINPISGVFDGSLPKDGFANIMLSSQKNYIEFNPPILGGGLQFQTLRFILNSVSTASDDIRTLISIDYE